MFLRVTVILLAILTLVACATVPTSQNGVYRPDIYTKPWAYVKSFPINKATKQDILSYVGIPDKTYSENGIEYLSYKLTERIEYTYFIKEGIVFDVKAIAYDYWLPHKQAIYQSTLPSK